MRGRIGTMAAWLAIVAVFTAIPQAAAEEKTETFKFEAEVTRLMDILIHSLYSNRDVFLRELISNANDAIDKIRFQSLTDPSVLESEEKLEIRISTNTKEKTVTIQDTGIGMTKSDMINNLGTIAKSGTSSFLEKLSEDQKAGGMKTANLIGQFGVGFYSAFLVADRVTVISKNNDDSQQWRWTSKANAGFSIREDDSEPLGRGTKVILHLREDADIYLNTYMLEQIIKRYSEFVVFSIYLEAEYFEDEHGNEIVEGESEMTDEEIAEAEAEEEAEQAEGEEMDEEPEYDEADEDADEDIISEEGEEDEEEEEEEAEFEETEPKFKWKLINDVKPLWSREPSEITKEEYVSFFKAIAKTDKEPLTYIHFKAEGDVDFRGLLFIPKEPTRQVQDQENPDRKDLVKLYVKKVLVTDTIENGLLPNWLSMIVGIVDSDDLPINISRETLQQSKTLDAIKKKLLRKSLEAIKNLMDEEPYEKDEDAEEEEEGEKKPNSPYMEFWKVYGPTVKMGLVMDMPNRDRISKLVRFKSSKTDLEDPNDVITFEDYMDRMKDGQEYIYLHSGENIDSVKNSPFIEQLLDLDYEVLYLTDPIDEYLQQYFPEYQGTKLMAAAKDNFRLGSEDDEIIRAKAKRGKQSIKSLLTFLKGALGSDKVSNVRTSMKLTRSACALSTEQFGYTARMETVMRAQALSNPDKVNNIPKQKVMEVNPYHPIILGLNKLIEADPESEMATDIANAMYDTALVASGYYLHDHTDHGLRISRLMASTLGMDPNMTLEEPPEPEDGDEEEEDEDEAVEEELDDYGGMGDFKIDVGDLEEGDAEEIDDYDEDKEETL